MSIIKILYYKANCNFEDAMHKSCIKQQHIELDQNLKLQLMADKAPYRP